VGSTNPEVSCGSATVLVGEDEAEVRSYLEMALQCQGYTVELAEDGEEVLTYLNRPGPPVDAILLDMMMPRKDGFETLREIRRSGKQMPVIMISGQASPPNVREALQLGATHFLSKPVSHHELHSALAHLLGHGPVSVPGESARQECFVSRRGATELDFLLNKIGGADMPVLIQGETGSGKEVYARQLHQRSSRAHRPFLKLNCAALPSELVESELFGYERGAFTGAQQKKPGMFELADGGTLLLDEIGDMDFRLQAKLLQVLQDQEFYRIGGKDPVRVDVRVIAATHRNLQKAIDEGTFREDLYYRLNVLTIHVPPLRERPDEIVPLAEFLLAKHSPAGTPPLKVTPALAACLTAHSWPGNVRELENAMRKYLVFRNEEFLINDLQDHSRKAPAGEPEFSATAAAAVPAAAAARYLELQAPAGSLHEVNRAKAVAETELILETLNATRWNRKRAAAMLNIEYKALLYKMKKLSISTSR
jgi:two-component system, NtrC family, response regulator AtoC